MVVSRKRSILSSPGSIRASTSFEARLVLLKEVWGLKRWYPSWVGAGSVSDLSLCYVKTGFRATLRSTQLKWEDGLRSSPSTRKFLIKANPC